MLLAPPLAEELNRSRRQLSLMSHAFAQAGIQVLMLDLKGTGDSPGDFSDATWKDWIDDLEHGWEWLRERTGLSPVIWGVRGGCWLGMELARRIAAPARMLFWQPQKLGSVYLNQWLRQKTAGDMLQGLPKAEPDQLRSQWAAGGVVEIGGYALTANIAQPLHAADLGAAAPRTEIQVLECASGELDVPSPGSVALQQEWKREECKVRWQRVRGEAYWQLQESPDQTELVSATLSVLLRASE
ncbi:MAG: hypothetical protein RLZZ126_117 [Pseudomonadota bacterium]